MSDCERVSAGLGDCGILLGVARAGTPISTGVVVGVVAVGVVVSGPGP